MQGPGGGVAPNAAHTAAAGGETVADAAVEEGVRLSDGDAVVTVTDGEGDAVVTVADGEGDDEDGRGIADTVAVADATRVEETDGEAEVSTMTELSSTRKV